MQQLKLFIDNFDFNREIKFESITAGFIVISEWVYDVLLNINSNKFLIRLETSMNKIEKFEIIAVKWFIDISVSIIKTIKKIIYKLYFDY